MNPLFKVFSIIETIVAGPDKGVTYSEIVAAFRTSNSKRPDRVRIFKL